MRTTDLNSELAFPLYGLPAKLQGVIREVAESRQAPIDYVAAPALTAIAVSAGKGAKIVDDYENNTNLFVGVVGDSAANKSTPAADILKPLYTIHGKMVNAYEMAMELFLIEEKATRGKKGKNDHDNAATPKPPKPTQLILTDVTPEARFEALRNNENGLLWHRDELKALFDDFGRYNQSGEASDLLTIFDTGSITLNRKGDGLKYLKNPILSVFGTIQPRALHATFDKTIFLDSGLVPRFLWFNASEMPIRDFSKSRKPNPAQMIWWDSFLNCLYTHRFEEPIRIDKGARAILDDFRNATGNGKDGYEATIWGKLHIYAYKLAGIAAIAHGYEDCFEAPVIVSEEAVSWAIDCCYYFHRTAQDVEGYCRGTSFNKGQLIRDFFKAYPGIRQEDFAQLIGTSKQYVSKTIKPFRQ